MIKAAIRRNLWYPMTVLLALMVWAGPGHAVSYDVEIIIFEHASSTGVGLSLIHI